MKRLPLLLLFPLIGLTGCAEVTALRQRNSQLEQTIQQLSQENQDFQKAYYDIKATLDSTVSKGEQDSVRLQQDLENARTLKSSKEKTLEDDLRTSRLEFEALKTEAADQKTLSDTLLATLTREKQELDAQRVAALTKVDELTAALTAEQQRGAELDAQLGQLKVDIQTLQGQVKALQTANEEQARASEASLAEANAALGENKTALETRTRESEAAQAENAQLKTRVAELEQAIEAIRASSPSTDTLNATRAESESLRKQLAEAQASLEQQKAESAAALEKAQTEAASRAGAAEATSRLDKDPALVEATTALLAVYSKAEGNEGVQVKLDGSGVRAIIPADSLFEPNSMNISARGQSLLRPVVDVLGGLGGRSVLVEGHTDNDSVANLPFADNWGLGLARADKVRGWLMEQGVSGSRLTSASRAQYAPLASNDTEAGKMTNRRVEIIIGAKK